MMGVREGRGGLMRRGRLSFGAAATKLGWRGGVVWRGEGVCDERQSFLSV